MINKIGKELDSSEKKEKNEINKMKIKMEKSKQTTQKYKKS